MSGSGAAQVKADGTGMTVAVIASSWHAQVMGGLLAGAARAIERSGATHEVFTVPGSFELPIAAQAAAVSGRFDAVVALGVIIRGGTPHFDYVCEATSTGLQSVALATGVPVGFGLLTCDNDEQALDRAGLPGSREDKGAEAADAAIATAVLLRDLA